MTSSSKMNEEPAFLINDDHVMRIGHYETRPVWGALLIAVQMSGGSISSQQFAGLCGRSARFRGCDAVLWGAALASMLDAHPSARYVSVEGLLESPPRDALCGGRPGCLLREDTPGDTGLGPDTLYCTDVGTVRDVAQFLMESDLGFEVC